MSEASPSRACSRPATSTLPEASAAGSAVHRSRAPLPGELRSATVGVLLGGTSTEREVSLSSGREIVTALATPSSPEDLRGPARVRPVELDAHGRWVIDGEPHPPGRALSLLEDVDVFFLALHGGAGEDGSLQGFLSSAGRAWTGSGVLASAVAMDKVFGRNLMEARGVRVARGHSLDRAEWNASAAALTRELGAWPVGGWVVKPRAGGSSVGVSIPRSPAALADAVENALRFEDEVLVEEWVEGIELTGGVLWTPDCGVEALPVVEIRPKLGRFFDYEEKYSDGGAVELCPPESVDAATCERIRHLSRLAHTELRCGGYSRSDFLLPRGGSEPVFLELNTLPGMTPRSLLPLAARARGIDYRTLCLWITAEALLRSTRAT